MFPNIGRNIPFNTITHSDQTNSTENQENNPLPKLKKSSFDKFFEIVSHNWKTEYKSYDILSTNFAYLNAQNEWINCQGFVFTETGNKDYINGFNQKMRLSIHNIHSHAVRVNLYFQNPEYSPPLYINDCKSLLLSNFSVLLAAGTSVDVLLSRSESDYGFIGSIDNIFTMKIIVHPHCTLTKLAYIQNFSTIKNNRICDPYEI